MVFLSICAKFFRVRSVWRHIYTRHCGVTMRFFLLLLAIASISGGPVRAQDSGSDADGDYVLQKARDKYDSTSNDAAADASDDRQAAPDAAAGSGASDSRYKYQPFVISFLPGVSYPFGTWSTSLSAAPIGAITGPVDGAQGAGVFNIADGNVTGIQAAGVFNMAGGVRGVQTAGVFNMAGSVHAVQTAGVFNMAESVDGVQAAGVFNMAGSVQGIQAAGVLNIAREVDGTMIGLINIAENVDGMAIGLVNIIGNGIHEVSFDYQLGTGMIYTAYRSGTPFLYLSMYAGQTAPDIGRNAENISVGAGLGHRFESPFVTTDIEFTAELPLAAEGIVAFGQALCYEDPSKFQSLADWNSTFASVRATLALGRHRGFGPYVGIKADIGVVDSVIVPAFLRDSFGGSDAVEVQLFDLDFVIWPKLFLGIKF
jgi:hypothetical protein